MFQKSVKINLIHLNELNQHYFKFVFSFPKVCMLYVGGQELFFMMITEGIWTVIQLYYKKGGFM
jgi:hypothetical protein